MNIYNSLSERLSYATEKGGVLLSLFVTRTDLSRLKKLSFGKDTAQMEDQRKQISALLKMADENKIPWKDQNEILSLAYYPNSPDDPRPKSKR